MVQRKLTLVLGAGVSADLSYPTGDAVKKEIQEGIDPNGSLIKYLEKLEFDTDSHKMAPFRESLRFSQETSIDAYLKEFPDYAEMGKACIAAILMKRERDTDLSKKSQFYSTLFREFNKDGPENFNNSNISIITFNYDRSLEHFLHQALMHSSQKMTKEKCEEKLKNIPIIHVHGKLGPLDWQEENGREYGWPITIEEQLPAIKSAYQGIRVIHEEDDRFSEFERAQLALKDADVICFIGFGYHKLNMERLNIADYLGKEIFGTCKGNDNTAVSRIRRIFGGNILLANRGDSTADFFREWFDMAEKRPIKNLHWENTTT